MTQDYARLIRERRIALGLSRLRLAARAQVAETVIRLIEGKNLIPAQAALNRICEALGIKPITTERS